MNNRGKVKILPIIILVIILLLLGGLAAFFIFLTPGHISRDKAVAAYYTAISSEDKDLYRNTCYTKKWQDNYDNTEAKIGMDAAIDVAYEFQSGATYGDVEVTALEKLDKEYADKMNETVKSIYGFDPGVKAISKVNFTVKINFEGEKEDSGTLTRYVYKSGGKWYFLAEPDVIVLLDLG
ncbi:MAG: hypothetical protein J5517_04055 [Eubacterium sp.]|nr:hypothetical protein [Eubacterium sp.]